MTQTDKSVRRAYVKTEDYSTDNVYNTSFSTNESFREEYSERDFFQGADLPGYKQLIKQRANATNPALAFQRTWKNKRGSAYHVTVSRGWQDGDNGTQALIQTVKTRWQTSGVWDIVPGPGEPTLDSQCVDMARARFVSKASALMSPFQGGPFLAEIRETIRAIRHPAQALRAGISAYNRKISQRSRRYLNRRVVQERQVNSMVAGTWLEACFGWQPLLHDIDDGAKALAQVITQTYPLTPVRASASLKSDPVETQSSMAGGGSEIATYSITTMGSSKAVIYGAIDHQVAQPASLRTAFGLRLHDVVPTVWEIIPYSFVIDYFSNIGEIISAASFPTSYLAWHGMSTTATAERYSHNFQRKGRDTYSELQDNFGGITPGESRATYKKFTRSVAPSLVPSLQFKLPGVKQGFNILALLQQARAAQIGVQHVLKKDARNANYD